jgi:hypothetical protein
LQRLAVILLLAIVTGLGVNSINRARAAADKPIQWLFNGPGVAAMAASPEASRILQNTRPFVMWGRSITGVPPNWGAVPVISFKNFGAIRDALEMGTLGPEIKGVMYDYEKWRFTPVEEQKNPAGYVMEAANLVHARGLLFLTAPAVNLVEVMEPNASPKQRDETYLRLGIAADAARYADVFDIQAQRFESDTARYANFVRQAAAQARQANPKVVVLAGISTQPIGQQVTVNEILSAIAATRDVVDGYWFNIPEPSEYSPLATAFRPDIAVDVLRLLVAQ